MVLLTLLVSPIVVLCAMLDVDLGAAAMFAGFMASLLTLSAVSWYFSPRWIYWSRKANRDIYDNEWRENRWPFYRWACTLLVGGAWATTAALAIAALVMGQG
ncbi:MAG: hypothetical protein R2726_04755 [Acidimicrobiales bacterium]